MTTEDIGETVRTIGRIDAIPHILDVIHRSTGMGCVAVARVTGGQWVACSVLDEMGFGLKPHDELGLGTTLCDVVRTTRERIVIEDVATDPLYADHPSPKIYGYKSFVSVPIVLGDGSVFGTLCAIAAQPMVLQDAKTLGLFKLFAELVAFHYDAALALERKEAELAAERAVAETREESIAALGHDLRNPLAALDSGIRLLRGNPDHPRRDMIHDQMSLSVARMDSMVNDVLDMARATMGHGIPMQRQPVEALGETLESVVDELRSIHPDRVVDSRIAISRTVDVDSGSIGRMVSNLLGNALAYGAADKPIGIEASDQGGTVRISVANGGDPIPAEEMRRIFEPFARGRVVAGKGLGLGLYIARSIADAHGGKLAVSSDETETRFTFTMPA